MDQKEVSEKVRKCKELIKKHFDIKAVYLFGSYAAEIINKKVT